MSKRLLAIKIFIMVTLLSATLTTIKWAEAGSLVQVSDASLFGAIESCGNFPGVVVGPGTVFLDSEVEPWVVINPDDSDNIVAFYQQDRWSNGGARGNVAAVSFDGGESWQFVLVAGITDCTGGSWERASDPWISFSPDGTLHQMSLVFDIDPSPNRPGGFGRNGMAVSKSVDGGVTWSNPIMLIEDDNPQILNDKNSITADPTDSDYVYAVWDRLKISGAETIHPENVMPGRGFAFGVGLVFKGPIYFARSTDGGNSWERARKIYEPGALDQTIGNQIVVLPDGTLIDFFTELKNVENSDQGGPGFRYNIAFLRSNDKGDTWQPRGRAIQATRIITTFGAVTPNVETPIRDASLLFDVAVDPFNGNLYMVWQDSRFNNIEQVAFSMSTDGGYTWTVPLKINKTPDNANVLREQAILPSVAVTGGGIVGVTYYDFRNDDATGEMADHWLVYCSTSCSDIANWTETRLTDTSFDYSKAPLANGLFLGDYVGLDADDDSFVAFFPQSSAGDPANGYFRRFTLP